jgi:predicted PurR-regulated permease PerM
VNDLLLRRIFILAAIVVIGWIIYLLQPVLAPFVAAFVLAYLFNPLVLRLMRFGLPRWLSISSVFIGISVGLVLATWYLLPMIWDQLVYAKNSLPAAVKWINYTVQPWLSRTFHIDLMKVDLDELSNMIMQYIQTNYSTDSLQQFAYRLAQSGLSIIHVGGVLILIPIITFYFLLDWENMLAKLRLLIPRSVEPKVITIVRECDNVLSAFVKGQFLVMILLGVVYAVGLQIIGIEVGLIIGMIAGLASIIPYLGFATGIIAAVIACFLQYGLNWMQLALVGTVFMIGQIIESYVLQPFLLGDKIGLSPVAVVFAILAGAQLFGFVGMLIALPVAAIIVVLLRHAKDSYQSSVFYGASLNTTASGYVDHEGNTHASNITVDPKDIQISIDPVENKPSEDKIVIKQDSEPS